MKAKEKVELLKKLCDECNPKEEAVLALYTTRKKGDYFAVGDSSLIRTGIYDIIKCALEEDASWQQQTVAKAIVGAFYDVLNEGLYPEELVDDDDMEDCGDCPYMRFCDQEDAIAYRRANHIPMPRKNKHRRVDIKVN